jgi:type IV pilus assembly protein PilY1
MAMMKRLTIIIITIFLFFIFLSSSNLYAAMSDYCVVPPYVIQDVPPNVMIVLDTSGSMFSFAYYDGFNTTTPSDDNDCGNSGTPCTGFLTPGTYPTYQYYGYFNPDYWYTYSSNRFYPSAPKPGSGISGARAKLSTEWDGNFLNWLTMRRLDVVRKILTGGKTETGEASGWSRLVAERGVDCTEWGKYMRITNANHPEDYTPFAAGADRSFTVNTSGGSCIGGGTSAASTFTVSGTTYNVKVAVPSPVNGVLQEAATRSRLGLAIYTTSGSGGKVKVYVSGTSLSNMVTQINTTRPNGYTPLAETLWTVTGYFAQQASIAAVGSPGPRYTSTDYSIGNSYDPYNYGTSSSPRWPYCSKSFVLFITDGEPCNDGNLPATLQNYASGKSNFNCSGSNCPAASPFAGGTISPPYCASGAVAGMEDVALWMHTTDLRNNGGTPNIGVNNMTGSQTLSLYTVSAFGRGSALLRYASINGGFEDLTGDNQPDLQSEWDSNSDNEPDNFYEADEGYALESAIRNALSSILRRASSGTAASVLASGEGRGANLIQAVFYPRRRFGNDIIFWTGENQNLWYYVDPFFVSSNIREDTVAESPDRKLNLVDDYIAQLYFDTTAQLTKARRYQDTDGDGDADITKPTVSFESVGNIWGAGELLWSRDITTDPRSVYTTITGTSLTSFSTVNASILRTYLQAVDDTDSEYIIRYTHGEGLTTLLDEDGSIVIAGIDRKGYCSLTTATSCTINANCPSGETCVADGIDDYRGRYAQIGSDTHVWKFGDIINSTPRIASWIPLNTYDSKYNDATYQSFITTADYKNRGMVFTGGNDGMLHAFKLGKLEIPGLLGNTCTFGTHDKACLTNATPSNPIGKEMWAFIPKNVLPYLKYIMDPEYCHVYAVDLSPFIFDASIGAPGSGDVSGNVRNTSAWRTILIGGMRYGGACRNITGSCNTTTGGLPDCVKTPIDGIGHSSYFALDITDSLAHQDDPIGYPPELLWEFSSDNLGFATTGPAVVRVGDSDKNGKWFIVLGSGPTGPISTTDQQFLGRSDQNLRLFVLNLKDGSLERNIDTTVPFAFAGSMLSATNDPDINYKDDVVYIGYVKRTGSSPNYTWTDGGIGRLITKEDINPNNWVWSQVIDGIGPVTSSVAQLQNQRKGILWLYFGTGRYFFEQASTTDDADNQRRLLGIKEPCFSVSGFNTSCTSTVSIGSLTNVTSIGSIPSEDTANSSGFNGWYINLEPSGNYTYNEGGTPVTRGYRAERVITDPLATTTGLSFFTTYKPYSDECGLGGKSFIWGVRYNTGGSGGTLLKGTALLQVSTGSIEQVNLSQSLTEMGGRRTSALEGVPPTAQGLSLLSPPPPAKRTIHIKER